MSTVGVRNLRLGRELAPLRSLTPPITTHHHPPSTHHPPATIHPPTHPPTGAELAPLRSRMTCVCSLRKALVFILNEWQEDVRVGLDVVDAPLPDLEMRCFATS